MWFATVTSWCCSTPARRGRTEAATEPELAALGLALDDLSLVVNSHAHPDHMGGNEVLAARTGARFAAPAAEVARLEDNDLLLEQLWGASPEAYRLSDDDRSRDRSTCSAPGSASTTSCATGTGCRRRADPWRSSRPAVTALATSRCCTSRRGCCSRFDDVQGRGVPFLDSDLWLGPLYEDVSRYRAGLLRLLDLDFDALVPSHGDPLDASAGRQRIEESVTWIDDVDAHARALLRRRGSLDVAELAASIGTELGNFGGICLQTVQMARAHLDQLTREGLVAPRWHAAPSPRSPSHEQPDDRRLDGAAPTTSDAEVDALLGLAREAGPVLAASEPVRRAQLLDGLADALDAARDELVPLAPRGDRAAADRLVGEVARTSGQLRMFAPVVLEGSMFEAVLDDADADASPAPPGPAPDAASARAGRGVRGQQLPVRVQRPGRRHRVGARGGLPGGGQGAPGHPGRQRRDRRVAGRWCANRAGQRGRSRLVHGTEAGVRVLSAPEVKAAGFTGSVAGGLALEQVAQRRPDPIPFYGELGSTNPVVVTPAAAAERGPRSPPGSSAPSPSAPASSARSQACSCCPSGTVWRPTSSRPCPPRRRRRC